MSIDAQTLTPEMEVTVDIETVTPDQAADWLENHNTHNRRIRKSHVAQMVRDMEANNFMFTGDSIKFSWDDVLLDGQHRLSAIVQSGKPADLIVVRGLDPRSQAAMDIQSRRLAYDALRLQGADGDMKGAAAIARGVFMYDEGRVPTHLETIRYVEDHIEELADAVEVSEMVRRHSELRGGSFYGIAFYLLARVDAAAAHDFFEKLASGANLEEGNPILTLRRKLAKGLPFGFGRGQWHLKQNFALVVIAWLAYRDGRQLTAIRMPKGELPEPR